MAKRPTGKNPPQPIPFDEILAAQERLKVSQNQERMTLDEFKKILKEDSKKLDAINNTLEDGLLSNKPGTLGGTIERLLSDIKDSRLGGGASSSPGSDSNRREPIPREHQAALSDANKVIASMAQEAGRPYRNILERTGNRIFNAKMNISDLFGENNKSRATANRIINKMSGGLLRRKASDRDLFLEEQIAAGTTKSDKEIRRDYEIHRKASIKLDENRRKTESLRRRNRMSKEAFEAGPGAALLEEQNRLTGIIAGVDVRAAKALMGGDKRSSGGAALTGASANIAAQNNMEAALENYKEIEKQTGLLQKIEENTRCCCENKRKKNETNAASNSAAGDASSADGSLVDTALAAGAGAAGAGLAKRFNLRGMLGTAGRFIGRAGRFLGRASIPLTAALSMYENREELLSTGAVDPNKQAKKTYSGLSDLFDTKDDFFSMKRLSGAGDVLSGVPGTALGVVTQANKEQMSRIGSAAQKLSDPNDTSLFSMNKLKGVVEMMTSLGPMGTMLGIANQGKKAALDAYGVWKKPTGDIDTSTASKAKAYSTEVAAAPDFRTPSTRVDVAADKKTLIDAATSTIDYQDKAEKDQKESLSTLGSIKDILGKVLLGILGISDAQASEFPSGKMSAPTSANFDNKSVSFPGGVDTKNIQTLNNTNFPTSGTDISLPPEARALLDTISGPESGGQYNKIYGGKTFSDFSKHPGIGVRIERGPNKGKTSSAAGKYQFLESTWNEQAKKLGLKDFSPANQDKAAWNLAQEAYNKGGRNLLEDLKSNDPLKQAQIAQRLSKIWTSLPSGIEAGTTIGKFSSTYNKNLSNINQNPGDAQNTLSSSNISTIPSNFKISDISNEAKGFGFGGYGNLKDKKGFVIHHTAGRGDVRGVQKTFGSRNLGTQFVIDREGNVFRTLPEGAKGQHMRSDKSTTLNKKLGLSNSNTEGVEIIAKDDSDVTPIQIEAAKNLAQSLGYKSNQIFGHGELNTHKQSTEGHKVVSAIRQLSDAASSSPTGAISSPQSINQSTTASMTPATGSMNVNAASVNIQSASNADASMRANAGSGSNQPTIINNVDNSTNNKNFANVSRPARDSNTPMDRFAQVMI